MTSRRTARPTPSSTRPTRACSEAAASTAPSTGAAGPELLEECRLLGGCDTGDAKITGAGRLPCGTSSTPSARSGAAAESGEPELLASCYRRAIELAAEHGCRRVAFPAISAGIYGYPLEQAAEVALRATAEALERHPEVEEARFWLFDQRAYDAFSAWIHR